MEENTWNQNIKIGNILKRYKLPEKISPTRNSYRVARNCGLPGPDTNTTPPTKMPTPHTTPIFQNSMRTGISTTAGEGR
jgi:hypothetical protein